MNILKCVAEYDKVYYVVYKNKIHQCKFIATELVNGEACYILDVAGVGTISIPNRIPSGGGWWNSSRCESILAESPEDIRRGKYLLDWYGTTNNAYNSRFLEPLFPHYDVCVCGGGILFWEWDGIKAVCYRVQENVPIYWRYDKDGFHCSLNRMPDIEDRYPSRKACEDAHEPEVVTF
jgi:hypothetical protein